MCGKTFGDEIPDNTFIPTRTPQPKKESQEKTNETTKAKTGDEL